MNGCGWQKKSFTISMKSTKETDKCSKCEELLFGIRYKFNGEILCKKCFGNKSSIAQNNGLGFYTSKDKLWEFETHHLGKRVDIRSKGQWKKFMKRHGLHDDVSKPDFNKQTYKPVSRKFIAEKMMENLQKKGTYHKLVPELRKALRR